MTIDIPLGPFRSGTAEARVMIDQGCGSVLTWKIQWVREFPVDQRHKAISYGIWRQVFDSSWRKLNNHEREGFERQYFRDLLGDALYMQALHGAWLAAKPAELVEYERVTTSEEAT